MVDKLANDLQLTQGIVGLVPAPPHQRPKLAPTPQLDPLKKNTTCHGSRNHKTSTNWIKNSSSLSALFRNISFWTISVSSILLSFLDNKLGPLSGLLLPAHILQQDTHYSTDNIHMVRHVIIIISYQWLNVETREHLSPVRKCKEQWRGSAAHGLLKCLGPESWTTFSKTSFMCWTLFFQVLYKSGRIFSLVLHSFKFSSTVYV